MHDSRIVGRALLLAQSGLNDREVAQKYGVSTRAVNHRRRGKRRSQDSHGGKSIRAKHGCPRCDDRPLDHQAYHYLLAPHLGDGRIARCAKGVFRLDIFW